MRLIQKNLQACRMLKPNPSVAYWANALRSAGLELFFDHFLEHAVVQLCFCVHLLELAVFRFQVPQPLQIRSFHSSIFGLPSVKCGSCYSQLPRDFLDGYPRLCLLDCPNDRPCREFALAQGASFATMTVYFYLVSIYGMLTHAIGIIKTFRCHRSDDHR